MPPTQQQEEGSAVSWSMRTSWSRCGTEQRPNWSLSSKGKAQQQEPMLPAPVSGRLLQALFSSSPAGSAHDGGVTHPKALIHCRHPRTKQGSRPRSQVHIPPPPCLIAPKPYPSCFKTKKAQLSAVGRRGRELLELSQHLKLLTHAQPKPQPSGQLCCRHAHALGWCCRISTDRK